jgi:hypothetical protein
MVARGASNKSFVAGFAGAAEPAKVMPVPATRVDVKMSRLERFMIVSPYIINIITDKRCSSWVLLCSFIYYVALQNVWVGQPMLVMASLMDFMDLNSLVSCRDAPMPLPCRHITSPHAHCAIGSDKLTS